MYKKKKKKKKTTKTHKLKLPKEKKQHTQTQEIEFSSQPFFRILIEQKSTFGYLNNFIQSNLSPRRPKISRHIRQMTIYDRLF
jgi:hypothetical protein